MKAKTIYTQRPEEVEVVEAPNGAIAYFRENIEEIEAPGEEGGTAYQADEYFTYIVGTFATAQARVTANPDAWRAKAKADEERRQAEEDAAGGEDAADLLMELAADHEERICVLELLTEEV